MSQSRRLTACYLTVISSCPVKSIFACAGQRCQLLARCVLSVEKYFQGSNLLLSLQS